MLGSVVSDGRRRDIAFGDLIDKFGSVITSSTWAAVTWDAHLYMPQDPKRLRVASGGNAKDAFGSTGAVAVSITGIGHDGLVVTDFVPTTGASASALTTASMFRVYRVGCVDGSYATRAGILTGSASNTGDVTIEDEDSETRLVIPAKFGFAQFAALTTPINKGARLYNLNISIQGASSKVIDLRIKVRRNALVGGQLVAVPGTGSRTVWNKTVEGSAGFLTEARRLMFPMAPLTDIWFEARSTGGAGTALVSIGFSGELCNPRHLTRAYFT